MAGKVKILVVDDSALIRRMVGEMLSSDPLLEVVGAASNGKIALLRIPQLNPDVVVLDVEMPELDGLQTLAAIRRQHNSLPVIMFSTLTVRAAATTLDALALGANDYVAKPSSTGGAAQDITSVRRELIRKIKVHALRVDDAVPSAPALGPVSHAGKPAAVPGVAQRVGVVVIGVSTGGPNALAELMPSLPGDLPVPVLIVQHMPPMFTRLLSERLAARSRIPVEEARGGQILEPGKAWIAPGDHHMALRRAGARIEIETNREAPENFCRPAVDVLFRSAAAVYGPEVLGVMMTGMGQDGLRGCEEIRAGNGQVIAQDEASSVVWGMPGFVVRAGLADKVLPLSELGAEITRRVVRNRSAAQGRGMGLQV